MPLPVPRWCCRCGGGSSGAGRSIAPRPDGRSPALRRRRAVRYSEGMEITWLGRSCVRIRSKEATVVADPCDKGTGYSLGRPTADVVTVSHSDPAHSYVDGVAGQPRVIEGPGEFEIAGMSVVGVATWRGKEKTPESGRNVAYVFELEDMRVGHLGGIGHVPTSDQIEAMGGVDILLVGVGGGESLEAAQAAEAVALLEPKIVIP